MEITQKQADGVLEVSVEGRLDSYWADHLATVLNNSIQEGSHRITLNLSGVRYISSLGIRVLLQHYKQLQAIDGVFRIANPSAAVVKVLTISGLAGFLLAEPGEAEKPDATAEAKVIERDGVRYEAFDLDPRTSLECRLIGDSSKLDGCRFQREDCHAVTIDESSIALGVGAFGRDYEECKSRFGEFLAAAGTAAYLPTDGTGTPDYLVSAVSALPEMTMLYGLVCRGSFGHLARFESSKETGAASLSQLAKECLAIADTGTAGIVLVAECAGLVGASLRRSPVGAEVARAPFGHPEIREWITFAPERVYPKSVALVVGVVSKSPDPALAPLLRPFDGKDLPAGHFHAAAFSYQPVARGRIEVRQTIAKLYGSERLEGVIHLLNDNRRIVGAGESEFTRGACWIGPISSVVREGGRP